MKTWFALLLGAMFLPLASPADSQTAPPQAPPAPTRARASRPRGRLLVQPLGPEARGTLFHSGGRQFANQDDPDYKVLMQWVGVK